jgi:phage shock protein C
MAITKRLYRSREDKIVAGVCGGMGEYFNVDPVWIRLIFVLLTIVDGAGILIYVVCWILMPLNPGQKPTTDTFAEKTVDTLAKKIKSKHEHSKTAKDIPKPPARRNHSGAIIFGLILILLGTAFMLKYLFKSFNMMFTWPIIIIAIGLYLIFRRVNE